LNVLVVDDEPAICWGLEELLSRQGFHVHSAGSAEKGLELAGRYPIDMVLLDVRLPGISGIEALGMFQTATHQASVIVMSAFGDLETAVEVVKRGACDYLHKPFGLAEVLNVCQKAIRVRQLIGQAASQTSERPDGQGVATKDIGPFDIGGNSPAMQRVYRQIALVADSDLSVLIRGETGTGKELVAAAIHRHSLRSQKSYVPIAPVTFSASLLESELFGHVRGAFTGATVDRAGLFETASGGTVLLDEIGDLPLSMQVKLLRVLEQRQYCRVGEIQNRPCNVRVLSATHHDLRQSVEEGRFRQDLLYRLSAAEVHLPALRERPEDIRPFVIHFLQLTGYPKAHEAVSTELVVHLQKREWLGNIRELRNAVERAAVIARGRPLDISDFPVDRDLGSNWNPAEKAAESVLVWARRTLLEFAGQGEPPILEGSSALAESASQAGLYERFLSTVEPPLFQAVLEAVQGNRSAAAEVLGIHRATLRQRLRQYGME